MPKRKFEDEDEWSRNKDVILNMYMAQDKSLGEVIDLMASRGFKRTKPQYERTFKQWGVSKNVREEEWNFIFGRLRERQRMNKVSVVRVRGVVISDARLKKQSTKLRQTVFEQCLENTGRSSRAETPPGIEVNTPPSTPTHDIDERPSTLTHERSETTTYDRTTSEGAMNRLFNDFREKDDALKVTESESNPNFSWFQGTGMVKLGDAIVEGDFGLLYELLSDKTLPVRLSSQHGVRALRLAVRYHRVEFLPKLLLAGADPYCRLQPGVEGLVDFDRSHKLTDAQCALETALFVGDSIMVEIILMIPIYYLAENKRLDCQKQLSVAYVSAICTGNAKLVAVLLKHGISPEAVGTVMGPDYFKRRLDVARQAASEAHDLAEVERLLQAGAPLESHNLEGASPPSFFSSSYLPKMEANFLKDFICCGLHLASLHDLLQHFEETHATKCTDP